MALILGQDKKIRWTGMDNKEYTLNYRDRGYKVDGEDIDIEEFPGWLRKAVKISKIPVILGEPKLHTIQGTNIWKVYRDGSPKHYRRCLHCEAIELTSKEVCYKVLDNLRIGFCPECVSTGDFRDSEYHGKVRNREFRRYERDERYTIFRDEFLHNHPVCEMCGGVSSMIRLEPYSLKDMLRIAKDRGAKNYEQIMTYITESFFNKTYARALCPKCHRERVSQRRREGK